MQSLKKCLDASLQESHVVGGGWDMFLNQKIKTFTGKEVYAGPVEGTALGNLMDFKC